MEYISDILLEIGVPNATLYLRQKVPVMRYPNKITEQSTYKKRLCWTGENGICKKKTGGATVALPVLCSFR